MQFLEVESNDWMQVDGTNTYDAAVGIACNEFPTFSPRSGKYAVAASFVMRIFVNKVSINH